MSHMLVEWLGESERQFSVVKTLSISNGELRKEKQSLVGKTVGIQWGRGRGRKEHDAKVLAIGDEVALDKRADQLAEEESQKEVEVVEIKKSNKERDDIRKRRIGKQVSAASQLTTVERIEAVNNAVILPAANEEIGSFGPEMMDDDQCEIQDNLPPDSNGGEEAKSKYKRKYKELRKKYKMLKTEHAKLLEERNAESNVELMPNSGVFLKRSNIEASKILSSSMTVLARNLFRTLFTSDELSTHSLFGKVCNANKNMPPLPAIDQVRRDAVIGFVLNEYVTNEGGTTSKEFQKQKKAAKRAIIKSLSDFLREESRNAKKNV